MARESSYVLPAPILDHMAKSLLSIVALMIVGVIVGVVGAISHRAVPYWGLVLAIVLVAAASVYARAWRSWPGVVAFVGTWLVVVAVFSLEGPGGSILIIADRFGYTFLASSAVVIGIVAAIPRRLLAGSDDVTH